jgi:hypothetical protein
LSIFEETGGAQSAVAQDRSLELFCDRYGLIAQFAGEAVRGTDLPQRRRELIGQPTPFFRCPTGPGSRR